MTDKGQSDWSKDRVGKNHCMCLGAWALYKARQDKEEIQKTTNELQCESIMDDALESKYIDNWNTWNGNELPGQIVQGVNQVMDQCYSKGTQQQQNYLINLYNNLHKPPIPYIFHFIFFGYTEFLMLHYLAIKSCYDLFNNSRETSSFI